MLCPNTCARTIASASPTSRPWNFVSISNPPPVRYSFNDEPMPAHRGDGFRARFSLSCNNDLVMYRLRNENMPEQLRKEILGRQETLLQPDLINGFLGDVDFDLKLHDCSTLPLGPYRARAAGAAAFAAGGAM